eukprot:gene3242-4057_t
MYKELIGSLSRPIGVIDIEITRDNYNLDIFSVIKNQTQLKVLWIRINDKTNEIKFKIPSGSLPDSLKELSISNNDYTKKPVEDRLYDVLGLGSIGGTALEKLELDYDFIFHPLIKWTPEEIIPESVNELVIYQWDFRRDCIKSLKPFPSSIESLYIEVTSDDQEEDSNIPMKPGVILPKGLIQFGLDRLTLAGGKIHIEDGAIPSSVKYMEHYHIVDSIQKGVFPNSIIDFNIDSEFLPVIEPESIPSSVKSLGISFMSKYSFPREALPKNLTQLSISCELTNPLLRSGLLPETLVDLKIKEKVDSDTCLPSSLTSLDCIFHTIKTGLLPSTLTTLVLRGQVQEIDIGSIPLSTKKIHFWQSILCPIVPGMLNFGLSVIKIWKPIKLIAPFSIPQTVTTLEINFDPTFRTMLSDIIPDSVQRLVIISSQVIPLPFQMTLPSHLKSLSTQYILDSNTVPLPKTIESLCLPIINDSNLLPQYINSILSYFQIESLIKISIRNSLDLLSLGINDPYLYYKESHINRFDEGFISKQNIFPFLSSFFFRRIKNLN